MDDLSNFVSMEPVEVCTAEATAASLLTWRKTLGVPRVWVGDTATHFKNAILAEFRSRRLCLVFQADDRSLIVLVDWVGFEVDERTWEPFKEIFEAAPEFLAKELRKLRVTRAIAARIKNVFGIQL